MEPNSKKTILLVEDEITTLIYTAKILGNFGYNVVTASSGEEAAEIALRNEDINLILMDIDLGDGIDGTETAEIILKKRNIPVVFLSSHTKPEIVEKTEKITSYGYVVKSSSTTVLDVSIKMAFKLFMSNQKVMESEERYRTLIESQLEVVCVWLPDTTLTFVNEAYCRLVGKTSDELIGRKWIEFIPEHARSEVLENYKNAVATKQVYSYIHEVEGVVGIRWYRWNDVPLFDIEGNLLHFQSVGHDITERKKIEDALEEKSLFQKTLIDSIPAPVFYKDTNGRYLGFNKAYVEFFGKEESELIGKTVYDISPKDLADTYNKADIELYNNPGTQIYESQIKDARGELHDVVFHKAVFYDSGGNIAGLIGVILDITESKQTKEKLSLSMNIVENIQIGLHVYKLEDLNDDRSLRMVYANPASVEFTGIAVEDVIGKTLDKNFPGLREKNIPQRYAEVARTKKPLFFEDIYYGDDRVLENAFSIKVFPLPDDKVGVSFEKITERKKFESDIIVAIQNADIFKDQAEQATREKEVLLKEVHHRIKNNMNTITGLLNLQADTMKDHPAAVNALNDAGNRVQSMSILYDKLYRSIEFKKMSIKEYFPTLIDEIVANFPNSKFVKVEKKIDDVMISAKILSSLGIIINELITNIMKYAFTGREEGLITVVASSIGAGSKPGSTRLRFEIKDNGIGIPESVDVENSTGFGFKLVSMLAKQIGGSIKVERNNGTKFILEFEVK